jgi:Ca2+-binding RTX toxin-like protein
LRGSNVGNVIDGGGGNDTIDGQGGNDLVIGGAGNDGLTGGAGTDTLDYGTATGAVVVDMKAGTSTGAAGNDTFSGFEAVRGSNFGDTITGTTGAFTINAGNGNDTVFAGNLALLQFSDGDIDGGSGTDTLNYTKSFGGVLLKINIGAVVGAAGDVFLNFESYVGSNQSDTFVASIRAETMDGAGGTDTLDYSTSGAAVDVSLVTSVQSGGDAQGDTISNFENLTGSASSDTLRGSGVSNIVEGGRGSDTLFGNGGDDTFAYTQEELNRGAQDTIKDFSAGDKIDLSEVDADRAAPGDQAFNAPFPAASTNGVARTLIFFVQGGNTFIHLETDNSGLAFGQDLQIRLDGVHNLTSSDFVL